MGVAVSNKRPVVQRVGRKIVRVERIETATDWDPKALSEFRDKWSLNQMDLIRLLQRYGLEKLNFSTYQRWEKGRSIPRPLYCDAIRAALRSADRHLAEARGGQPVEKPKKRR